MRTERRKGRGGWRRRVVRCGRRLEDLSLFLVALENTRRVCYASFGIVIVSEASYGV